MNYKSRHLLLHYYQHKIKPPKIELRVLVENISKIQHLLTYGILFGWKYTLYHNYNYNNFYR